MKRLIFTYISIALVSCMSNKDAIKTIHKNRLEITTDSLCLNRYYFKNEPLNGTYKIKQKHLFSKNYSIWNIKNGYFNGENSYYNKGYISNLINYKNGLMDGYYISYVNGVKSVSQTYKEGLLWGQDIYYTNQGNDTISIAEIFADKNKMNLYATDIHTLKYYSSISLNLLLNTCILEASVYYQNFYLKKDSTLVYEKVWLRADDGTYHLDTRTKY